MQKNRVLSFVLALILAIGIVATPAALAAEDDDYTAEVENEDETTRSSLLLPPPPPPPPVGQEPELPPGRFYTGRALGLHEYKGAERSTAFITPQVVTVLEDHGDWLLIRTWLGPRWIYLNYVPSTEPLDELLRRFPNTAVFYKNIETGFTYRWNADRVFFGASVSKAPFALYIYQRAESGEFDLDRPITFTRQDWHGGSGIIRHRYAIGRALTTRRVLELNLYESDNTATNMLRRTFGISGYRQFVADLGGNPSLINYRIFNSRLTANEVGRFAVAIWDYIESDGRYSEEFRNALLNNQFPFITSNYPMASKTGWTAPIAWHDMAIIYAPSPYILVIMTERPGHTARDRQAFYEISRAFERFNDRWF